MHRLAILGFLSSLLVLPLAALATSPVDASAADANAVGEVAFANSGAPAAQEPFLRGLALLHNFEYPDAAEQFKKAQALDAGFAMAYWGEAMTYTHPVWMQQDAEAARAVLGLLGPTPEARLARAGTERKKDYLRAVEVLYGKGTKEERDLLYADAMAALHARYPEDVERIAGREIQLPAQVSDALRQGTLGDSLGQDLPGELRDGLALDLRPLPKGLAQTFVRADR